MSTTDTLADIREKKNGALEAKAATLKARDEAGKALSGADPTDTKSAEFQAAQAAVAAHAEASEKLERLYEAEILALELRGESAPAGNPTDPRAEGWDTSRVLAEGRQEKLKAWAESSGMVSHGRLEAGYVASRETLAAEIGTSTVGGLIQPDRRGLQPTIQRPLDILSLVSTGTTNSNLIEYVQSVGINSGALEVAEGAVKPELALTFTDADAPVRTIAGWLKLRKQTLADAPALQAFVDNQIRYAVQRRLNDQIMAGNGTGENLRGILNTTGVQTTTVAGSDNIADRILKGLTSVLLTDQAASAVALNPIDWQKIMLLRDRSGGDDASGGYIFGGPAGTVTARVWGLPAVASQAIPVGTAVVGDFAQAQVMVRDGLKVLFSDSDVDDFQRNRVTLLGEMRAGLLVWRPDAFAKVNLGVVA